MRASVAPGLATAVASPLVELALVDARILVLWEHVLTAPLAPKGKDPPASLHRFRV